MMTKSFGMMKFSPTKFFNFVFLSSMNLIRSVSSHFDDFSSIWKNFTQRKVTNKKNRKNFFSLTKCFPYRVSTWTL